jgi:hypothetical protein
LAAHSNSAWASGHCLVTDATVPPLPAEEVVAIEEKAEDNKAAIY